MEACASFYSRGPGEAHTSRLYSPGLGEACTSRLAHHFIAQAQERRAIEDRTSLSLSSYQAQNTCREAEKPGLSWRTCTLFTVPHGSWEKLKVEDVCASPGPQLSNTEKPRPKKTKQYKQKSRIS